MNIKFLILTNFQLVEQFNKIFIFSVTKMVGYHSGTRSNWSMAIPKGYLSSYNWPYKINQLASNWEKILVCFSVQRTYYCWTESTCKQWQHAMRVKKGKEKVFTVYLLSFIEYCTIFSFRSLCHTHNKVPTFLLSLFLCPPQMRKMLFSPSQKSLHHNETERGNITKLEKECLRVMTDESPLSPEGISSVTYIYFYFHVIKLT